MSLFPHIGFGFEDFGFNLGPSVHTRATEEGLTLELEVPRYRQEEIEVKVEPHNTLVIAGKRANEMSRHDRFLFGDTPSTSFRRALHIPYEYDTSKMKWELSHGVLVITIPHAPQVKPPEPQRLPIAGSQTAQPQTHQQGGTLTTRDKHGMELSTTSNPEEFQAVARMNWPPKIKREEADGRITYTCSMPPTVTSDHLDLSLQGRNLTLGVHHQLQQIKKDSAGNTVFNQQQSVQYSTNLLVPEGTSASDISTSYNNGNLTITVSKHDNPSQSVPVKKN
jgi:HSP20 family molecular chaperone IbpA